MGAAVTDERCRALRVKLNKHCYHQSLSEDSVLLVETMLNDLIASTASLNDLKRRDKEGTERLQSLISELEVFRIENPRLQAENNALHLQIIESDEATETWEDSIRTAVRKLEDEIEAVKLTLQKEGRKLARREHEFYNLQAEVASQDHLEDCTDRPSLRAPGRATMPLDADPLLAKEESLTEALQLCKNKVLDVESQIAGAVMRAREQSSDANDICEELCRKDPGPAFVRQKVVQASLHASVADLRATSAERFQRRMELEMQQSALQEKIGRMEAHASELLEEEASVQQEEAKVAARASEIHARNRVDAEKQRRELEQTEEETAAMRQVCARLESSRQLLTTQAQEVSRREVLRASEQSRQAKELGDKLLEASGQSSQAGALGRRLAALEADLASTEDECRATDASNVQLQEEVQSAQMEAELQTRRLAAQRQELQGDLQSGAQLQHRSQRAGAQLQFLTASLPGLTAEQKLLARRLQEQQSELHEESMARIDLQVEAQRLASMAKSLDGTREEWTADLAKAVVTLRQSHGLLATALEREEVAQTTSDRLRHEVAATEASLQTVQAEKEALHNEVSASSQKLRQGIQLRDEAHELGARLHGQWQSEVEAAHLAKEAIGAGSAFRSSRSDTYWEPSSGAEIAEGLRHLRDEVTELKEAIAHTDTKLALMRSKVKVQGADHLQRVELSRALEGSRQSERALAAAEAAASLKEAACQRLRRDLQELQDLVAAESPDALRQELADCQKRLADVAEEQQTAISGWGEKQRAAAHEVEVLKKAARALDAERDEKQRLADERVQELQDLGMALQADQEVLLEAQKALDDLRANSNNQQHHLGQQQELRTERSDRLESLQQEARRLRAQVRDRTTEEASIHDDLMHMTKANQELHEEVRQLEIGVAARTVDARRHLEEKEASAQQLHAIELERTDIARLHEHVCLQTREYEVALQRLQHDRERARRAAGELAKEVQRIKGLEDTWHGSAEQCQLDMRVMQEQLAEIAQRIQRSEQTQREALEEDAKLKGDVAAATAAAQGADHSQASQAQQVAALRLRRHQLQTAVQQARGEAATQHRLAEQERHQVRRLEALLEGGQMKLQRSTADLEALRRCLEHQRSPAALGSFVQESPSVNELKQQVEREYSKVGELDAEQQSLQAEVLRLRAELRRLKGLKPT